MLVLERKCEEKIRIGNNITITVFRIEGKAVRLGIEAPSDITVLRGELRPTLSDAATQRETERKVDLVRVPRDEVASTLRKLIGDNLRPAR
jgi:carbon storage regulator CsrA